MTTHAAFGEALETAKQAEVQVLFLPCHIEPDSMSVLPDTVFDWR